MDARTVDDAALRLRELRREEWSDLALGAAAVAAALVTTHVQPGFALPLLLGGFFLGARGLIAAWRRWDLVDELAGEHDAYAIDEIQAHASRAATMERRRLFAASIRSTLRVEGDQRLRMAMPELETLVAELEDDGLVLDLPCAVACARLATDPYRSPLLDRSSTPDEVRFQVRHIRGGFAPRDPT